MSVSIMQIVLYCDIFIMPLMVEDKVVMPIGNRQDQG